jgi:hypothetical protein
MSLNILFISDTILIERTTVHGNIDPKLLYPEIKTAQDMYIQPLLGTALYSKLQTDIQAQTVTGYYSTLLNDYIIDTLINYTLMELPTTISYQMFNKGVIKSGGQDLETVSINDLVSISDRYKRRAEFYAERMKRYLIEESNRGNFPEYLNPGSRADTVRPYGGTFSLPIYLGEDCKSKRNRPGWNPQENLSDCC